MAHIFDSQTCSTMAGMIKIGFRAQDPINTNAHATSERIAMTVWNEIYHRQTATKNGRWVTEKIWKILWRLTFFLNSISIYRLSSGMYILYPHLVDLVVEWNDEEEFRDGKPEPNAEETALNKGEDRTYLWGYLKKKPIVKEHEFQKSQNRYRGAAAAHSRREESVVPGSHCRWRRRGNSVSHG